MEFQLNSHLVKMLEAVIERKIRQCLLEPISYTKKLVTGLVNSIQRSKFCKNSKASQQMNKISLSINSVKNNHFKLLYEDPEVDNKSKFLMILIKFVTDLFKSFQLLKDDVTGLEKSILMILLYLTNLMDSTQFQIAVYVNSFDLYSLYMQINCFNLKPAAKAKLRT